MDGFELTKRIREFSQVPIIMLTAKGEEEDKLRGFELGADDYVSKPFSRVELIARVKAVLKRSKGTAASSVPVLFKCNDLEVNFARRRLIRDGKETSLTPTEYRLLEELVSNRERSSPTPIFSRKSGEANTGTKSSTCMYSSGIYAPRSRPILPTRSTSRMSSE